MLERILRQYGYVQIILISPATFLALELEDVVVAFQDFPVHALGQAQRGRHTTSRKQWKYDEGYIRWFYHVSHPIMSDLTFVAEYTAHVRPYEEVIVQQQWARQVPDSPHIIANIRARVAREMGHPDVFMSLVFTGVLQGIQLEYNILQEEAVPQGRTRSQSPEE